MHVAACRPGGADVLSLQDTDLMQGLLETMVVLWEGAKERLNRPANKTVREKLVKKISESLSLLFDTFKVHISDCGNQVHVQKKETWREKKKLEKKKTKSKSLGSLPSLLECQTPGALDRRWLGITGGLVAYPVILLVSELPKESSRHIGYRLRKPRIRLYACASNT